MKKVLVVLFSVFVLTFLVTCFSLATEKEFNIEKENVLIENDDIKEVFSIPDNAITSDDPKFAKTYKEMGIFFEENPSLTTYSANENNYGEAQDYIDYYKDEIKSIKIEHLLYTALSNKELEKRIPVTVITLEGVKLQGRGGSPFGSQKSIDETNMICETKIVLDEQTKEIISMYSGSYKK